MLNTLGTSHSAGSHSWQDNGSASSLFTLSADGTNQCLAAEWLLSAASPVCLTYTRKSFGSEGAPFGGVMRQGTAGKDTELPL